MTIMRTSVEDGWQREPHGPLPDGAKLAGRGGAGEGPIRLPLVPWKYE
jgi:hypothetical protein